MLPVYLLIAVDCVDKPMGLNYPLHAWTREAVTEIKAAPAADPEEGKAAHWLRKIAIDHANLRTVTSTGHAPD